MDFDRTDLAMFVYNVALIITGGYLVITFEIEDMLLFTVFALVAGAVWTIYYHYQMADLLEGIRTGDLYETEDDPEDGPEDTPEDAKIEEPPEGEGERHGTDAPWE